MGIGWETATLAFSVVAFFASFFWLGILQLRVIRAVLEHHKSKGPRMGLFQASEFDLNALPARLRRRWVWAWIICVVCFCVMFGIAILVQPEAFAAHSR